jgi:hypothetical protein
MSPRKRTRLGTGKWEEKTGMDWMHKTPNTTRASLNFPVPWRSGGLADEGFGDGV